MLTIFLTFQKHQKKNTQDNTRVTHLSPANLQELLLWYKVAVMQSNWSPHTDKPVFPLKIILFGVRGEGGTEHPGVNSPVQQHRTRQTPEKH